MSLKMSFFFFIIALTKDFRASLVAQTVRNPPPVREAWVQSLGWQDLLEEGMATHSSILAWKIPWTEEPGRLQSMGPQRVRHNGATFTFRQLVPQSKRYQNFLR